MDYYEEYLQEIEDQEELVKQLPNPKELGRTLKKGIENGEEFDFMDAIKKVKDFVSLGACASAKKQMVFLLIYTIIATGIYDFAQAIFHNSSVFMNQETGSATIWLVASWGMMVIGFGGVLYLALKKQWFPPLNHGFQYYYFVHLLLPPLVLVGLLKVTHLPYAFSPVHIFLESLDLSTVPSRFIAYQSWNYLTLHFPVYFFFFVAILLLLPMNFMYHKKALVL
ncbi:MAG: hypothetical protein R3Y63_04005 [Eubacteriales bacterium]